MSARLLIAVMLAMFVVACEEGTPTATRPPSTDVPAATATAIVAPIDTPTPVPPTATPTPVPPTTTPTPEPEAPSLTAHELIAEREANATRFDVERKGKWVRVSGTVDRIENGKVYLLGDGFLSDVVLQDLSQETQISLNIGDQFSATCKVGNYILGSIFMEDCQA